jgi:hypothetical protein
MYYAAQFGKKINRIRKKNWSAPTIMGAFILTCMIIIYSFEYLGLTNKEKNLDHRITNPENLIKVVSNTVKINRHIQENTPPENLGSTYFKFLTQKDKEKHLIEMKNILLEAAEHQYNYENPESFMQKLLKSYNVNFNDEEMSKNNNSSKIIFFKNNFKCASNNSQLIEDDHNFVFDI